MIYFQALNEWKWDLTGYGLTFNEESDIFFNESKKNYSFPLNVEFDEETTANLGLVVIENITRYRIKVRGYLYVDDQFFDAYLLINEIQGLKAELQFFYGSEVLAVFDKKLSSLPWPIIDVDNDFKAHVASQINKAYPEVSHNFPMVYRPQITQVQNYEKFEGFVNNHGSNGLFENYDVAIEEETTVYNINVVSPMPYLLEILRMGFATEGKEIRGDMINHPALRRLVVVPKKYLENYSNTASRVFFQFNYPTSQETINNSTVNVYTKVIVPGSAGYYHLDMTINLPAGLATIFDLQVSYGDEELYRATIESQAVEIDETVNFEVKDSESFADLKVLLRLSEQQNTIQGINRFAFYRDGGEVNVYPNQYDLSDFVPDMKFRTFFNRVKKWLGLDVEFLENAVYLNFLNNSMLNRNFEDHSSLQDPDKKRSLSKNNLFKIKYSTGQKLMVAGTGIVYSDDEFNESETEDIDFEIRPIKIGENKSRITGVYPDEEPNDLLVGIYNSPTNNRPLLNSNWEGADFSLSYMYKVFHKVFLLFRANSEEYKDSFYSHFAMKFNLRNGIFKYNKKHLIKKIRRRRVSEGFWKIDQESETF